MPIFDAVFESWLIRSMSLTIKSIHTDPSLLLYRINSFYVKAYFSPTPTPKPENPPTLCEINALVNARECFSFV